MKSGPFTEWQKDSLAKAKKKTQDIIQEETGMLLDVPSSKGGTTNTGPVSWRFFSPEVRPALLRLLPDKEKDNYLKFHWALSIIFRVFSSKKKV
jgi:hypothetical protein